MKNITALQGPKMTVEISDRELQSAKRIKKEFKAAIKELDEAVKSVFDLRDAILEQRPSKEILKLKYKGRLLRYRRKIRDVTNKFLMSVKSLLEQLKEILDPEMLSLRDVIISEVNELSDGIEALLEVLGEADREGFTDTIEKISKQLEKRQKSISEVIEDQLFGHIDHDILGRRKISELQFNIRKRSRLLKYLIPQKH